MFPALIREKVHLPLHSISYSQISIDLSITYRSREESNFIDRFFFYLRASKKINPLVRWQPAETKLRKKKPRGVCKWFRGKTDDTLRKKQE